MPVTKNGSGEIVETPFTDLRDFEETGVVRDDTFAISDDLDRTKQLKFNANSLSADSSVTIAAGASSGNITLTLPTASGTLVTSAGETPSFSTIQCPSGTSPTADSASDTLTLVEGTGITISGNATTDTITISASGGGDLKSDGTVAMTANFNLDSHKLVNVTDPASAQDAATKNYVDTNERKEGVIGITIDGGGGVITTGVKGYIEAPFSGTIAGWTIVADVSGSCVVDVWKDTYANFPPTVADTIAGSEKPTLSAVQKNQDLTLSTWTTSVTKGDVIGFNVDSATTVTRVTVSLRITKSS
jgi:hypothetical protein